MPSIVFLILLAVFIVVFVAIMILTKTFVTKTNIAYVVPIALVVWGMYIEGYRYTYGYFDFIAAYQTLAATIWAFMFRIERDYVQALVQDDAIFKIAINLGVTLCGITAWSAILAFIKIAVVNWLHVFKRLHWGDVDIVYGHDDDAIEYCKNSRDAILFVDPKKRRLSSEDKKALFLQNVYVVHRPFSGKTLSKLLRFVRGNAEVIVFQRGDDLLASTFAAIETLKTNKSLEIRFKVQSDLGHLGYIDEQLSLRARANKNARIIAESFDYHEIIARDFSSHHNLALYMPSSFLKDGMLREGKKARVVLVGFGKTGKAVYRSILLNNQFVTVKDGHFACAPIDVILIDYESASFATTDVSYIQNFSMLRAETPHGELPPFELTARVRTMTIDATGEVSEELLRVVQGDEDTFTLYVLSSGRTMDNCVLAERLCSLVDPRRSKILYNVDHHDERLMGDYPLATPFGFKEEILSSEHFHADALYRLAKNQNEAYSSRAQSTDEFANLPIIEKLSNLYAEMNVRFKLNLLGFDLVTGGEGIDAPSFYAVYDPEGEREREVRYPDSYYAINARNALAYQEHLRWCMFYFLNGYRSMGLSEIEWKDKPVHKDPKGKRHACLVSYYALDDVHRYELGLYLLHDVEKTISQVETYQYDCAILDGIHASLESVDWHVVPKD